MKKEINIDKIKSLIEELLVELGEDKDREGLVDTPIRAAKMLAEMLSSTGLSVEEMATQINKTFMYDDTLTESETLVAVKDIPSFSMCEHHLALMYDMTISVVYRPHNLVAGLSKIARAVDLVTHKLQLQERIGKELCELVSLITSSPDVLIKVKSMHACMSARGAKKVSSPTVTLYYTGVFLEDNALRENALSLINS